MSWKLTVRAGPRVERQRFAELTAALNALERCAEQQAQAAPRGAIDARVKHFEPVQQVVARLELAGPERLLPTVRAGIDVRGDGSIEAYLGHVKRKLVAQQEGETPYGALRRELDSETGGS